MNFKHKIRKDLFYSASDCELLDDILFTSGIKLIKNEFNIDISYRERYRLGHYDGTRGGFYIPHTDTQGGQKHRRISCVICLSDSSHYEGGIFRFINLNKEFKFTLGDAIFFNSELLHGVDPVTKGDRNVIITFLWDHSGELIRFAKTQTLPTNYIPNKFPLANSLCKSDELCSCWKYKSI